MKNKNKNFERGRIHIRRFAAGEDEIASRTEYLRRLAVDNPCLCGGERIFQNMSEDELRAAIKAGVLQILFYEHLQYGANEMGMHVGYVGHLFYALNAKREDVLNCSIIEDTGKGK